MIKMLQKIQDRNAEQKREERKSEKKGKNGCGLNSFAIRTQIISNLLFSPLKTNFGK